MDPIPDFNDADRAENIRANPEYRELDAVRFPVEQARML
jgi:hypothetical protein